MRLWIVLCGVSLALVGPRPVSAQPADAHSTAAEQFQEGIRARDGGDYSRALELFRKSHELEPGRGKLLNIAMCEEQLGRPAAALQHFRDLLVQLDSGDERLPLVRQYVERLEPRVPGLRIRFAAAVTPDAHVALDGQPVAASALGSELRIDAGQHTVAVSASGRRERRYDVRLEVGAHMELSVQPGDVVSAPLTLRPAVTGAIPRAIAAIEIPRFAGRRAAGVLAEGVGALGFGIGIATGAVALSDHAHTQAQCPTHTNCTQAVIDTASTGKMLTIVSTAGFALGAAGGGVGTYLLVTSRPRKVERSASLTVSLTGPGLMLGGRF